MKFIFQGNGFPFFLLILFSFCAKNIVICRWGDEVERTSPFQIYYIHLRVGGRGEKTPSFDLFFRLRSRGAPTRRCALTSKLFQETQTPSPCESTLAVESYVYDTLYHRPLLQISRAAMHKP